MFTLFGPRGRFCDDISRRSFLTVGGLAIGGLSLPTLLRAEEQLGKRRSTKAVIMVYLSGGLAHQDTFDPKPNAPAEVRGEFGPISTNVPGVQLSELLPRTAAVMDKVALIRSLYGLRDEHSSWQNLTGYPMGTAQREGRPNFGSVVARLQGSTDRILPAYVDLFPTMQHRPYNTPGAGLLGRVFSGVKVDSGDVAVMKLQGLSQARLADRRRLLGQFDHFRQAVDGAAAHGLDTFYERAFDVLTSSKLVEALDIEREPPAVRDRFGRGSARHLGDGAPMWNDQLVMARRLVEAGVRVVTVAYGFWDTHGNNFKYLRRHLPLFDQGLSALVEDLSDRGLDRDVSVVVWGEFGRTPKINKDAGRDHWARVNGAILFGGGMRVGQVIGSTDATAAYPKDQPIHYQDVLATVYHNLGISPHATVEDVSGRPTPLLPSTAKPIERMI
ncbi:MAG TPA: DUF1501 domain-containing protein [Gemmataceae bacterium]|nr:DUF1501 domain-containing protein [Gemmataceae bacterium]